MHLVAWVLGCTKSYTHYYYFVIIMNLEFSSHAHIMETLPPKKWFLQYLGEWRVFSGSHLDYDNSRVHSPRICSMTVV